MDTEQRKIRRIAKLNPRSFYVKLIIKLKILARISSDDDREVICEFIDVINSEIKSNDYSLNTLESCRELLIAIINSYDLSQNMVLSINSTIIKTKVVDVI